MKLDTLWWEDDGGQSGVGDINGDLRKLFLLKYSSHPAFSYLNIRLRYYESCINPMIHINAQIYNS